MTTITTYLCNKRIPVVGYPENKGINVRLQDFRDIDDEIKQRCIIEAWLVANGAVVHRHQVDTKIIEVNAPVLSCMSLQVPRFNWIRRINLTDTGEFLSRNQYIHIELEHPAVPCWWANTYLYIWRDQSEEMLFIRSSYSEGGMIPLGGEKSLVYIGHAGKSEYHTNSQTPAVPGELLQLKWEALINDLYFNDAVAGTYYHTPVFTGGKIINKTGEYEGAEYTVEIEGETCINCIPTDYAEYVIDDWVFIVKQGDREGAICGRESPYGSAHSGFSDQQTVYEDGIVKDVHREINRVRRQNGLSSLTISTHLTSAADRHSGDMADNKFMGHEGSDGSNPYERIQDSGYLKGYVEGEHSFATGENVAMGYSSAGIVVAAWMASTEHRENILREEFEETGISVKYDEFFIPYFTQKFGMFTYVGTEGHEPELRLLPMVVNTIGNANGVFEKLDYSTMSMADFGKFFEMSQHFGKIINVNYVEEKATVEISESTLSGTFENIPFFYHCKNSVDTTYGSRAFKKNDSVIVLCEGETCESLAPDLLIVGHRHGIKPCAEFFIIVSSPSGNEAFAYDPVTDSVFIEKDTYENVVALAGEVKAQALSDGNAERSQFTDAYTSYLSWGRGYGIITPAEELGSHGLRVVIHPDNLVSILNFTARAFGEDGGSGQPFNYNRSKWKEGEFVILQTTEDSSEVSVVSTTTQEGEFLPAEVSVSSENAITQEWTLTVRESSPDFRFVQIHGDTLGYIETFLYAHHGYSCSPFTTHDMGTGEEFANTPGKYLDTAGFVYNAIHGNHVVIDEKFIAPIVFHWGGVTTETVTTQDTTFEFLTGVQIPDEEEILFLPRRYFLFYTPVFSNPAWDTSYSYELRNEISFLRKSEWEGRSLYKFGFFDYWEDLDYSDFTTHPTSSAELHTTVGKAESMSGAVVYDAISMQYHKEEKEDIYGLHVFCRVGSEVLFSRYDKEMLDIMNEARIEGSISPLKPQVNLYWASERHTLDMVEHNFAGYTGSDGSTPGERVEESGYYLFDTYLGSYYSCYVYYRADGALTPQEFLDSTNLYDIYMNSSLLEIGIVSRLDTSGGLSVTINFGYVSSRIPGFSPIPHTSIQEYMLTNFDWTGENEEHRVPNIYLI